MRTDLRGSALFIGRGYLDITMLVDKVPVGDEKVMAKDSALSFGGNAVVAAFACAHLGFVPDLLCTCADDWSGKIFASMVEKYGIHWHKRHVQRFARSVVLPNDRMRAMARFPATDDYLHGFPRNLSVDGCRFLHVDGHQMEAAVYYAAEFRKRGIRTSLDAGGYREGMDDLLQYIDVCIAGERYCQDIGKDIDETLAYFRAKGCKVGGVTMGERGMRWYAGCEQPHIMPALAVPREKVIDTNGAGDIFRGAYIYSYLMQQERSWTQHFEFARAASAYAIQRLGNEASLPTVADVEAVMAEYRPAVLQAA